MRTYLGRRTQELAARETAGHELDSRPPFTVPYVVRAAPRAVHEAPDEPREVRYLAMFMSTLGTHSCATDKNPPCRI